MTAPIKKGGAILLALTLICLASVASAANEKITKDGYYKGIRLAGKVRVVEHFPDIKVKVNKSFPDLKVKVDQSFPNLKVKASGSSWTSAKISRSNSWSTSPTSRSDSSTPSPAWWIRQYSKSF